MPLNAFPPQSTVMDLHALPQTPPCSPPPKSPRFHAFSEGIPVPNAVAAAHSDSLAEVMAIISNHENSDEMLPEYFASSLDNFNSQTASDLLSYSHGGPRRPSAEQPSTCHCSGCSNSNAIHHVGQLSPSDAIDLCKSLGTLTPQLEADFLSAPTDNNITENKKRQRKRRIYYFPPWIVPLRGGTLAPKPTAEDGVPTPTKSTLYPQLGTPLIPPHILDPPSAGPKEVPPLDQIFVGDSLHHRYEVIRLLGCGWCGLVLLAFDHRINQHVAVKIIGRGELREEAAGAEFRILIKVRQKDPDGLAYIVRVLATFEHLGQKCIVTELLGPNLLDILDAANVILQTSSGLDSDTVSQRKQTFSMDQIRAVASQLFKALTLLRKLGIVHGDIKPENVVTALPSLVVPSISADQYVRQFILKTAPTQSVASAFETIIVPPSVTSTSASTPPSIEAKENPTGQLTLESEQFCPSLVPSGASASEKQLIDFGTAGPGWAQKGMYLGTRFYRSPEIVWGTNVTPAADMWSVGCLLAELYLGRPLFPARDEDALIEMVAYVLGPPPKKLTKGSVRRTALLQRIEENAAQRVTSIATSTPSLPPSSHMPSSTKSFTDPSPFITPENSAASSPFSPIVFPKLPGTGESYTTSDRDLAKRSLRVQTDFAPESQVSTDCDSTMEVDTGSAVTEVPTLPDELRTPRRPNRFHFLSLGKRWPAKAGEAGEVTLRAGEVSTQGTPTGESGEFDFRGFVEGDGSTMTVGSLGGTPTGWSDTVLPIQTPTKESVEKGSSKSVPVGSAFDVREILSAMFGAGVEEGFVDLVAQCLEYDSKKRLTPSAGLLHPWVVAGQVSEVTAQKSGVGVGRGLSKRWKEPKKKTGKLVFGDEGFGEESIEDKLKLGVGSQIVEKRSSRWLDLFGLHTGSHAPSRTPSRRAGALTPSPAIAAEVAEGAQASLSSEPPPPADMVDREPDSQKCISDDEADGGSKRFTRGLRRSLGLVSSRSVDSLRMAISKTTSDMFAERTIGKRRSSKNLAAQGSSDDVDGAEHGKSSRLSRTGSVRMVIPKALRDSSSISSTLERKHCEVDDPDMDGNRRLLEEVVAWLRRPAESSSMAPPLPAPPPPEKPASLKDEGERLRESTVKKPRRLDPVKQLQSLPLPPLSPNTSIHSTWSTSPSMVSDHDENGPRTTKGSNPELQKGRRRSGVSAHTSDVNARGSVDFPQISNGDMVPSVIQDAAAASDDEFESGSMRSSVDLHRFKQTRSRQRSRGAATIESSDWSATDGEDDLHGFFGLRDEISLGVGHEEEVEESGAGDDDDSDALDFALYSSLSKSLIQMSRQMALSPTPAPIPIVPVVPPKNSAPVVVVEDVEVGVDEGEQVKVGTEEALAGGKGGGGWGAWWSGKWGRPQPAAKRAR
ncbi:hypothetical protein BJ742DRAFT_833160 [Cladochytrium replicatum]|nr:hypothetical protein BJ742DRAFT_833160 [Cladochytrium replicatum]